MGVSVNLALAQRAARSGAVVIEQAGIRHAAAMRYPDRDRKCEHKIDMPADAGIEGKLARSGVFNPKILQFLDESCRLGDLFVNFETAFV